MIISIVHLGKENCDIIARQTGEQVLDYRNAKEAADVLENAEILISWWEIGIDILNTCKNLKWLFIMNAGVDKLPFSYLLEKKVIVTNVSGIHASQIAEQTLGMMIAFNRKFDKCLKNQMNKIWANLSPLEELSGKTLCIVGAGSIGKEIARKAKAFDMKVIGIKKHIEELEYFDEVWENGRLHEALGQSEYTVLIVPLTDETYHLIGLEEFKAMKPGSFFVNMSRGDVVDESALIEVLKNNYIGGAGLDVFHIEPLPSDSQLWELENVIITPHTAGLSPNNRKRAVDIFLNNYESFKQGKQMQNQIDLVKKY